MEIVVGSHNTLAAVEIDTASVVLYLTSHSFYSQEVSGFSGFSSGSSALTQSHGKEN